MNNKDILKQIPIQNYPEPFISVGKVRMIRLLDEYDALVSALEKISNYRYGGDTPPELRRIAAKALATLPE